MTEPQRSNPATIRPDALRMHHEQNPFDRRHAGAVIVGNAVWWVRCGSGRSARPRVRGLFGRTGIAHHGLRRPRHAESRHLGAAEQEGGEDHRTVQEGAPLDARDEAGSGQSASSYVRCVLQGQVAHVQRRQGAAGQLQDAHRGVNVLRRRLGQCPERFHQGGVVLYSRCWRVSSLRLKAEAGQEGQEGPLWSDALLRMIVRGSLGARSAPPGNHPPTIRNYTPFQKGIFIS